MELHNIGTKPPRVGAALVEACLQHLTVDSPYCKLLERQTGKSNLLEEAIGGQRCSFWY